jgi:hypothetical protein
VNDYDALRRRIEVAVASFPQRSIDVGGFGLLVGDPTSLRARRRAHARTVLLAQDALAEIVALSDQPVVLMKGLEVAELYERPTMRPFRDVDVLCADPSALWSALSERGYRHRASRRSDIDHHHLPALASPRGRIGVEVHVRPNTPAWANVPLTRLTLAAPPSRTGVDGLLRPPDDVHALLMALHCWKGGFVRLRDAYDAVLLASVSESDVESAAESLGLGAMWRWTIRFIDTELLRSGRPSHRLAARLALPGEAGVSGRRRARLLAPFLCNGPVAVVRSHATEYRLGRSARQVPTPKNP